MSRNRTRWLIPSIFVLLAVFGVITFFSPSVPQRKLDMLTVGIFQQDAERLLGRPTESFTWDDGTIVLRYTSGLHAGWVHVFFGRDGRYREYNYERF